MTPNQCHMVIALHPYVFSHSRQIAEHELTHAMHFQRELTYVGVFFSVS